MAQLDGVFILDLDEFLRPEYGDSVSLIAARWLDDPTIGAVAINWAVYGSSGRDEPGHGLVTERFTRRAEPQFVYNHLSKAFIRVSACDGFLNPHFAVLREGRYINTRGEPVTWMKADFHGLTTTLVWDKIRIDHFQVKSRTECERKKTRGDAFDADKIINDIANRTIAMKLTTRCRRHLLNARDRRLCVSPCSCALREVVSGAETPAASRPKAIS